MFEYMISGAFLCDGVAPLHNGPNCASQAVDVRPAGILWRVFSSLGIVVWHAKFNGRTHDAGETGA